MKLSKLYTNKPELFEPITFNPGMNVVMAEIRVPENVNRDTHNLGKTTLGRLLDFCLLSKRSPDFFLFKHLSVFEDFIFFLELELPDNLFVTIRRSVKEASKISFKRHTVRSMDFSESDLWDHSNIAFEKSREMLDGWFDWKSLKEWSFRNILGYQIRSQDDYRDVFQLSKYVGPHADWKPFVAHILGFNADLLVKHYAKESELRKKEEQEAEINMEIGGSIMDASKIEGLLSLKTKEAEKKQALLDSLDFRGPDKDMTKNLVENIDEDIASMNAKRYTLLQNRKKIAASLENDQILFSPENAQKLFEEAGVHFPGQIKKDFEQLIEFNKKITDERITYLAEDRAEIDKEVKSLNASLNSLGKKRAEVLSFLSSTDIFDKYKQYTNELVNLMTEIGGLERQKSHLHRLQELRTTIRTLREELTHLQGSIENDVESHNSDPFSLFSEIRLSFNEIVESVIARKALLSVAPNKLGHLEFTAEILDDSGNATSADMGHTYKKLMCVAFDLAVLRAHLNMKAPRFVFHDGVFESLDDRKKENLLTVLRQYSDMGIQLIITLIDSDLPKRVATDEQVFEKEEMIITLHDEGPKGRLFKIAPW